jgi:signal transduction histidine kinase/ligand-binding sensor domain-containing protein
MLLCAFAPVLAALAPVLAALGPVLACFGQAAAEPRGDTFLARVWTLADGLPQNSINDIVQTDDGALWLATFAGLLRFDGVRFRVFDPETLPALGTNRITALTPAARGGLWLATQAGDVLRFHEGDILERYPAPGFLEYLDLLEDRSGNLWATTSIGSIWRLANGVVEKVHSGHPANYQSLCLDRDGGIWVGAGEELLRFDSRGGLLSRIAVLEPILCLTQGSADAELWVGLHSGLARIQGGSLERVPTDVPFATGVTAIVSDGAGGLWLGTVGGPLQARPGSSGVYSFAKPVLPQGFAVRSLLVDAEHNLWVGSMDQGLARLTRRRFERYGSELGSVTALVPDGTGGAWIAFGCGGLVRVSGTGELTPPEEFLKEDGQRNCLHALLLDCSARLWMSLDQGLFLRDDAGLRLVHWRQRGEGRVTVIAQGLDGEVWTGAQDGKLFRIAPDLTVLEQHIVGSTIHALTIAQDGAVWIGLTDHLVRLVEGRWESYGAAEGVPPGDLRDVLVDDDGEAAWIAVYCGGLLRFTQAGLQRVSRSRGLPDASLSKLLADPGRLWLLANTGVIQAHEADLEDLLEGRAQVLHPTVYGPETGIAEGNYGSPAGFRDANGALWFGTISGAVQVIASALPADRALPTPIVEWLDADGRRSPAQHGLVVPAATKRVTLDYTTFALTTPERVIFRHRLSGFEGAWNVVGGVRSASYTELDPRVYRFEVEARSEDGIWSSHPGSLTFEVAPTWWQTREARALFLLALLGLLLSGHAASTRALRLRSAAREAVALERADAQEKIADLRDALAHVARSSTAGQLATSLAHEVNQPLTAIVANALAGQRFLAQDPLKREELSVILKEIAEQGQRASAVIKRLRTFLGRQPVERMAIDLGELVAATLPLVQRELRSHGLQVHTALSPGAPAIWGDPIQLQQVIVNLLMNACEAQPPGSGGGEIQVSVLTEGSFVALEVLDPGPGFSPGMLEQAFEPFITSKTTGMGLGLSICRQIVEAHGGRLVAANSPAGGALLRLTLPPLPPTLDRHDA